jgi:DtxR family Mn-dependent transcriptional regulator
MLIIMKKELTSSLEDYLEAIYILEKKHRVARVKDIAARLQVQMPSVTGALRNLREKGLVVYEKNSYINLTAEGMTKAEKIADRHDLLKGFLMEILLLDADRADEEACNIEHNIGPTTTHRIKNLITFIEDIQESQNISDQEWSRIMME